MRDGSCWGFRVTDLAKFRVHVVSDGATGLLPIVRVIGEIDLVTAPLLQEALMSTLATSRGGAVVDLDGFEFIDTPGIDALIAAANTARERGGQLVVQNPGPVVERVLDLFDLKGALSTVRTPNAVPEGGSIVGIFAELNELGNLPDQLDVAENRTLIADRLQQLRAAGCTIDRISELTGIGTSDVLTLLAELAANGNRGQGTPSLRQADRAPQGQPVNEQRHRPLPAPAGAVEPESAVYVSF
jgi:anti-sigma B factor antagonist